MVNPSIEEFRSLLRVELPTQADVDNLYNSNSMKTGKELTLNKSIRRMMSEN